jgi:transcriptional regulator with XRE-family HTH domain
LPFCKAALRAQKPHSAAYPKEIRTTGDHLKKKRLDLKMTQEEVAAKLQTTVCTYRGWERNQRNPSFRYMPSIIEFLGYVPFDMQFEDLGQRIRAYRQILGLRQKDLARQLGVDPTTIRYLEKSKHKPGKRVARELDGFFSSAARILSQRMRQSL